MLHSRGSLTLSALLALSCSTGSHSSSEQTHTAAIAAVLPGLHIAAGDLLHGDSSLRLRMFRYHSTQASWPYGTGFAVFDPRNRLLWTRMHDGDFAPHTVQLADFDGDARTDIFMLAGEEDVFETHVFLNRVAVDAFALSNFARGFSSDEVYAAVLDFNQDGHPELLLPEKQGGEIGQAQVDCGAPFRDGPLAREVIDEYNRVVGPFDALNFRYGMDSYRAMNLFMLDSIRIFSASSEQRWVSRDFREHLAWRVRLLDSARDIIDSRCRHRVDAVLAYLTSLLPDSTAGDPRVPAP